MNIFLSKKTIIFLYSLANFSILAEIFEIKHFHEILTYIIPGSLVLLDIDNTLLEPHDEHRQVGSDQWVGHLFKTHNNFEEALNFYFCTMLDIHMQAVEPTIPKVLEQVQHEATLLGFTMRSMVLAPHTVEQLRHNNIMIQPLLPDRGFMVDKKHPLLVYHDIIFCQGNKTGTALFTALDAYAIYPNCIIMIDDKRSYLESVQSECFKRNIPFIGLRYGYLDEKVAQFLKNCI